jgi:hypothetical protein
LVVIVVLGLGLRSWRLGASGFITPYYMASVRSMMVSWHNFFFNAFDPRRRPAQALVAGGWSARALGSDPKLLAFLQENH